MLLKLAWRNIWRNKRRTFITVASVAFAVFFAVTMQSIQKGAWDHMLNNVVNFYYGFGQIHKAGYWDDQTINKSFVYDNELAKKIHKVDGVQGAAPRIESFALAAADDKTTGILVVGSDPKTENELTGLADKIIEGNYWSADSKGALVAEGVADQLNLQLGDTIILISQGYHGANAAGKYQISGILKFGSPQLNKRMVYLPLVDAQYFFAAEGLVTTVALDIKQKEDVPQVLETLQTQLDTAEFEALGWKTMIPELVEAQELDAAGNKLVLLVLYLIIIFGVFGTILMMTRERQYEFGVLIGIGMPRWQLGLTVWMEIVFMGLLGAIMGMVLAFPLVYYFFANPIDLSAIGEDAAAAYEKFGMEPVLPAIIDPSIFMWQALIILAVTTLLAIYPFWQINSLKPIDAMRQ